jgi:hypothetical protein
LNQLAAPPALEPGAAPERFGLDARARSALRAYFRDDTSSRTHLRRLSALDAALASGDSIAAADAACRRRFLDLFASMLESDFSAEWLEQLGFSWRILRRAGGSADLPLRAARELVAVASRELLSGRSSLSALEVEIVDAVAAAGMCVAAYLGRTPVRSAAEPVVDDVGDRGQGLSLAKKLAQALAGAAGGVVGLLSLRLRLAPATLTLSREQRTALWEAVIERVRDHLREQDVLVRTELNGCSVILPGLHSHGQVLLAASKLSQALDAPLPIGGMTARAFSPRGPLGGAVRRTPAGGCPPGGLHRQGVLRRPRKRADVHPHPAADRPADRLVHRRRDAAALGG